MHTFSVGFSFPRLSRHCLLYLHGPAAPSKRSDGAHGGRSGPPWFPRRSGDAWGRGLALPAVSGKIYWVFPLYLEEKSWGAWRFSDKPIHWGFTPALILVTLVLSEERNKVCPRKLGLNANPWLVQKRNVDSVVLRNGMNWQKKPWAQWIKHH